MYAINEIAAAIDRMESELNKPELRGENATADPASQRGGDPKTQPSSRGLPGCQPRPVRRRCGVTAAVGKNGVAAVAGKRDEK